MIHPDTQLQWINDRLGLGVVATRPLPRGTILWALDALDQVLPQDVIGRLPAPIRPQLAPFLFKRLDDAPILCWDIARYLNHACEPTSRAVGHSFEIAQRDIAAGEQITCDYGDAHHVPYLRCQCGQASCRGTIGNNGDGRRRSKAISPETEPLFFDACGVRQPVLRYCRVDPRDQGMLATWRSHCPADT